MTRRHAHLTLFLAAISACTTQAQTTGDRWLQHLTQDLLPFWTMPSALGDPVGAFPSTRCDDGSLLDFKNPCAPIAGNAYLLTPARYLVPLSRQSYGYGVAYHLTGDPVYLNYMKAGVDYIRRNAIDPAGGMALQRDLAPNGAWGPRREWRDPQQLGYGLLCLGMYYYLTRDEAVLADLLTLKKYILDSYYNESIGTMQWLLANNGSTRFDQKNLVSDLDQMNTYLVLTTPLLPEPQQSEWKRSLLKLSRSMMGVFYSAPDNLFFTAATNPADSDISQTGVDVGHSSKALWMIRWTGLMTGDNGLVQFAETQGKRLFDRAYIPDDGSWAQGVLAGGKLDRDKNWWVYAELDQYSATLALVDPNAGRYLPKTNDYWFKYFVDTRYGEVWNGVRNGTNAPIRDWPKSWQWKSAYHSFEHALVGYITSQYIAGQSPKLYYSFQKTVDFATIRPYFYPGVIDTLIENRGTDGTHYQTISFKPLAIPSAPPVTFTSAASYLAVPLATGSIATAFGNSLATATQPASSTPLPAELAGTSVKIIDAQGAAFDAPLFFVSPGQVNFLVPAGIASGPASITVNVRNRPSLTGAARIASVAPAIFQSNPATGLVAAYATRVKADQSQTIESLADLDPATGDMRPRVLNLGPATEAVYLTLYGTGWAKARQFTVTVNGLAVPVTYAGPHATYTGLDQVNIGPLPRALAGRGRTSVVVVADNQTANPVYLMIR